MTWTPGYDIREVKRERGLLCVQEAADSWARLGRSSLDDDIFAAVFIRFMLAPESYRALPVEHGSLVGKAIPDLPARPVLEWRSGVSSPFDECQRYVATESLRFSIVTDLRRVIARAADQWSLGDPEKPSTDAVFRELAG